jgi:hypothetical protein
MKSADVDLRVNVESFKGGDDAANDQENNSDPEELAFHALASNWRRT